MTGLAAAFGFLTVIGRGSQPSRSAAPWFGLVGALIGWCVGATWWGANEIWSPFLAALLAVAADLVLTGALHADGLADTADGLLPHAPRERRLEIMRQPDVGAFGVVVLSIALLVRASSLAAIEPDIVMLTALWALSRACITVVMVAVPYARDGGLATPFLGGFRTVAVAAGSVMALVIAAMWWRAGWLGVATTLSVPVAVAALAMLAVRRVGGFTGDILGAGIFAGETVALVVLAGTW